MIKGISYGLFVNLINFVIFYLAIIKIMKNKPGSLGFIYFVSLVLRYFIIGAMIFVFLIFKLGSSLGLIIGFTAGILAFTAWRIWYGTHTRSNNI